MNLRKQALYALLSEWKSKTSDQLAQLSDADLMRARNVGPKTLPHLKALIAEGVSARTHYANASGGPSRFTAEQQVAYAKRLEVRALLSNWQVEMEREAMSAQMRQARPYPTVPYAGEA